MIVTTESIELDPLTLEDAVFVDIRIDEHRVFSARVPFAEAGRILLRWPRPLLPYLDGHGRVTVTDSATGRVLDGVDVALGTSSERLAVTDGRGRWLAMTKWDRLGPVLEGRDAQISQRLIANARALVADLDRDGYESYLVGGSLLGIVRNGGMLPHDDDIDLAFLCREEHPCDIGLSSYRMERMLSDRGYTVVRHSLAHLEIEFFTPTGEPDCYVDIFTGFFRGEDYCQPFALKGDAVTQADLVPTTPVELEGVELPQPRNPEAWLEYAYGADWRIPDPTFRFVTPAATQSRFETWFGVFNRGRVYWDKTYLSEERSPTITSKRAVARFLDAVPAGGRILDFGCGDGVRTQALTAHGHRVTGVDYSHEALRLARRNVDDAVDLHYLNMNDRAAALEFADWMLATGEPWYVFAHHSLQTLTRENRQTFFLFLDLALRSLGFADVVGDETLTSAYRRSMPSTWHLPVEWIAREIEGHPLEMREIARGKRTDDGLRRRTAHVRLTRVGGHVTTGDSSARYLKRLAARERKDTNA